MVERIKIQAGKPEDDVEPPVVEFAPGTLPKTAEEVARIIQEKSKEARDIPEEDLEDEHLFILDLEKALRDFQQSKGIPIVERMTLDILSAIIEGRVTPQYSSERMRDLYDFLTDRYPLTREEVTVEGVAGRAQTRAAETRALESVQTGMEDFWQKLYKAILRVEYAREFPKRIREDISDIVWEDDEKSREDLIQQLVSRSARFQPARNREFVRALHEQLIGPFPHTVMRNDDRANLAKFLAKHGRPIEAPFTGEEESAETDRLDELFRQMMLTSGEHATRADLEIILRDVERVATRPEQVQKKILESFDLVDEALLFQTIVELKPLQKHMFISALENFFFRGILRTVGSFVRVREIVREMSTDNKFVSATNDELRDWSQRLARELNEVRTAPAAEEPAALEKEEETTESILMALRAKNARLTPLVRAVTHFTPDDRKKVYQEIAKWVVVHSRIKNLPVRLGRTPRQPEVKVLVDLIESEGDSTNDTAWGMLLAVANRYRRFREGI